LVGEAVERSAAPSDSDIGEHETGEGRTSGSGRKSSMTPMAARSATTMTASPPQFATLKRMRALTAVLTTTPVFKGFLG
jgi:hypothetical protein